MQSINDDGLDLLKRFEGCKLDAYKDLAGVLTIGYGSTRNVFPGLRITEEDANERLCYDLKQFEKGVSTLVKVPINDNQFSALVCFAYNIGLGAFANSTMLRWLNKGSFLLAAAQFEDWDKVRGKQILGLKRRRADEKRLFLKSVPIKIVQVNSLS